LREIRIRYPRDSFFSKGWRRAVFHVRHLTYEVEPDELYPPKKKIILQFDLPRGSYATILVKRITSTQDLAMELGADETL
jgi:tRNA pseudouridine13 synthase